MEIWQKLWYWRNIYLKFSFASQKGDTSHLFIRTQKRIASRRSH